MVLVPPAVNRSARGVARWRCRSLVFTFLAGTVVLNACAAPTGSGRGEIGSAQPTGPKRVVAVVRGDVPTLVPDVPGPVPGLAEMVELVNVGLTTWGPGNTVVPRIAEEIPSTENGLWKVFADGRMETTWKIRRNAVWHDGTPVTADDFIFRAKVYQDQRMPFSGGSSAATLLRFVDTIEAPDPNTLVVKWKSIYLQANQGFDFPFAKHLLEPVYAQGDVERFLALPYWTTDFVGVGAYKMKSYAVGSGTILEAFDQYFLGRPKIDTIEVKFMVDPNTIGANILAGEVGRYLRRSAAAGLGAGDQGAVGECYVRHQHCESHGRLSEPAEPGPVCDSAARVPSRARACAGPQGDGR